MQVGPYRDLIFGSDGKVYHLDGPDLTDTKIKAANVQISGQGEVALRGDVLHPTQMKDAVAEFCKAFPAAKGKIRLDRDPAQVPRVGLAASDVWMVVDERVAVHPLAVRLMTFRGNLKTLRDDFAKLSLSELL